MYIYVGLGTRPLCTHPYTYYDTQEFSYASVEQESSGAQQQQVEQQVRQQRMQDRMLEGVDAAAEVANQTKQSKEKALASPEYVFYC